MSSAKMRKRAQIEKLANKVMNDTRFREERKKQEREYLLMAFCCFCLIGSDYMFRNFGCKEAGTKKFLDFVKSQLGYVGEDDDYFKGMNEALKDDAGFDVMDYMGMKFETE